MIFLLSAGKIGFAAMPISRYNVIPAKIKWVHNVTNAG
jgi:hypothetical protein